VTSHAAVISDARSIQISSQNIWIRRQASTPNYQSQPPLIGFTYNSRYNILLCTLDENIGGHIRTVTTSLVVSPA